jgi:hypothetical protein
MRPYDVDIAFRAAAKPNAYASQREWAFNTRIPVENIVGFTGTKALARTPEVLTTPEAIRFTSLAANSASPAGR